MSRAVPSWHGRTPDTKVPPRVRLRVFMQYDGRCQCGCGRKIVTGEPWELEHKLALINGGQHCELNLRPFLAGHQAAKTRVDVAEKSMIYRKRLKHHGIKKRSSFRGWRKFSGEVVFK